MTTECRSDIPLIFLFGATATGKSRLLQSLFSGRAEVINADAFQVYRDFSIGSAAPDISEKLPHHLTACRSPSRGFNVAVFVRAAHRLINRIDDRGKLVIISGGNAFYLKCLLDGLPTTPAPNRELRQRFQAEQQKPAGSLRLHRRLTQLDPHAAAAVPAANSHRLIRALEICVTSGRPLSSFHGDRPLTNRRLLIALRRDRSELAERIQTRVEEMFAGGLLAEIKELYGNPALQNSPLKKAIGYAEFADWDGRADTLGIVKQNIRRNSLKYSKRQHTFFKQFTDTHWFHPDQTDAINRLIENFIKPIN